MVWDCGVGVTVDTGVIDVFPAYFSGWISTLGREIGRTKETRG